MPTIDDLAKICAQAKNKELNFAAVKIGQKMELWADPSGQPKTILGELKQKHKKSKPFASGTLGPDEGGVIFRVEKLDPLFAKAFKQHLKENKTTVKFRVVEDGAENAALLGDLEDRDEDFADAKTGSALLWSRDVATALKAKLDPKGQYLRLEGAGVIGLTLNGEVMAALETAEGAPTRGHMIDACNLIFDKAIMATIKNAPDLEAQRKALIADAAKHGREGPAVDAFVQDHLARFIRDEVESKFLPDLRAKAKLTGEKIDEVAAKHWARLVQQNQHLQGGKLKTAVRIAIPAVGAVVAGSAMAAGVAAVATGAGAPAGIGAVLAGVATLRALSGHYQNMKTQFSDIRKICDSSEKDLQALLDRYEGEEGQTERWRTLWNSVVAKDALKTHGVVAKKIALMEKPLAKIEKVQAASRKAIQKSMNDIEALEKQLKSEGLSAREIEDDINVVDARGKLNDLLENVADAAATTRPLFDRYSELQAKMVDLEKIVNADDGFTRFIPAATETVFLLSNLSAGLPGVATAVDSTLVVMGLAADSMSSVAASADN